MRRKTSFNRILRSGKLCAQYVCDMSVKVSTREINFQRFNQSKLRSEKYSSLKR